MSEHLKLKILKQATNVFTNNNSEKKNWEKPNFIIDNLTPNGMSPSTQQAVIWDMFVSHEISLNPFLHSS